MFTVKIKTCVSKNMDDNDNCEHCNLDRVIFLDITQCLYLSIKNLCRDLRIGKSPLDALMQDDRILYVFGVLLALMTMRILLPKQDLRTTMIF